MTNPTDQEQSLADRQIAKLPKHDLGIDADDVFASQPETFQAVMTAGQAVWGTLRELSDNGPLPLPDADKVADQVAHLGLDDTQIALLTKIAEVYNGYLFHSEGLSKTGYRDYLRACRKAIESLAG